MWIFSNISSCSNLWSCIRLFVMYGFRGKINFLLLIFLKLHVLNSSTPFYFFIRLFLLTKDRKGTVRIISYKLLRFSRYLCFIFLQAEFFSTLYFVYHSMCGFILFLDLFQVHTSIFYFTPLHSHHHWR